MRTNILYAIFFSIILLNISNSYSQIINKNGVYYFNHQLVPSENQDVNDNIESRTSSSNYQFQIDTVQLPFIKQDFIVNTFDGDYGSNQTNVSTAIDGIGNYAFTWIDYREGKKQIYAQFYNYNDEQIGSNIKINENDIEGNNSPFIAVNKNGDFVIVWLRNFSDVMAQRLTSNGQKFGANFQINTIWGMNTMEPSVGVSKDGSFAVMWAAQITSNSYQVFAKLFDKFSNPLTSDLYINQPGVGVSSIGQGKHIGVDGKGNYCIAWSSYNNSNRSNIYLQIIDKAGQFIGINTLVSDTSDVSDKIFPEIASTDNGYFLIDWQINGQSINSSGVGARIYSINNGYVTDNLKLITSTYFLEPVYSFF